MHAKIREKKIKTYTHTLMNRSNDINARCSLKHQIECAAAASTEVEAEAAVQRAERIIAAASVANISAVTLARSPLIYICIFITKL